MRWLAGTAIIGLAGHKAHNYMPTSWRGDSGLWDVWSHISNVPDSMLVVSAGVMGMALARGDLFTSVPFRRACGTAAAGLALGCGVNAVFETPATANTPIMQEVFPNSAPDPIDEVYGDAAALISAALLANAMRQRPHSDNA